ncbi:MAG: hypothetical protein ABS939_02595 [Psychrobacillus sp.]
MEKQERMEILFKIDQLLFELEEAAPERKEEIEVELQHLGNCLTNGKNVKFVQSLTMTLEEYKQYKEKGLKDKEIAEIYNVTASAVGKWKDKHVFKKPSKKTGKSGRERFEMSVEEYENYIRLGMIDTQICERKMIANATLHRWKKKHNVSAVAIRRKYKESLNIQ